MTPGALAHITDTHSDGTKPDLTSHSCGWCGWEWQAVGIVQTHCIMCGILLNQKKLENGEKNGN